MLNILLKSSSSYTVRIKATTDKIMPNSNSKYTLKLKTEVRNLKDSTLKKAVYNIYNRRTYGNITDLQYDIV